MPATVGYSKRSRLDKLGVKPGMRVALVGLDDPAFLRELATRTRDVVRGRPRAGTGMILFRVTRRPQLARLATLERGLAPDGAIWAVWAKGRPELKGDDVRRAAIAHGLVDVKVMAFSETLSALKLVIPLARRRRPVPRAGPR